MIRFIIDFSLRNRLFVVMTAVLLLGWGAWETARMPVDVFPDLTAPQVTVVTEAHGMAPTEVEQLITLPIETALNGATGVRRVRSTSDVGISVVVVEFAWGTDIYQARQVVTEKLALARATLPAEIESPALAPIASVMGEIMFIALASDRHSAMDLRTAGDWTVRRRLLAVPGIAEVVPIGGDVRQYQIYVNPEQIAAYGITLEQVVHALRRSNQNVSAGFYVEGAQEYLIQGLGRVRSPEDLGETAVAVRGSEPVRLRQIAEVSIAAAPKRGTGAHNGKAAVVLGIQKQPGANTLELTRTLDAVLAEIQQSLPSGMRIETHIFRQADFISTSIDNLLLALRDGVVLVIAIVFVFLLSLRATAITLLAIPLSLVVAVIVLKAFGATINTMTLGGIAIALGALVDDAIIVVENIVRRLKLNQAVSGESRRPAAAVVLDATQEIQGSIVFATLVIMLVFLPLFFLAGVEGRLMIPLGIAYVVSLAASLLVAITVTPVLSALALPRSRLIGAAREPRGLTALKSRYGRLLSAVLPRWKAVLLASAVVLGGALAAFSAAGRAFLPEFNEGSLTLSVVTLPGTSLAESDRLGAAVENILLAQPEVAATARRTGRAERDPHAQGIHASEIDVSLRMKDRTKEVFLDELRQELGAVAGANIVIGQPISHRIDHLLSGTRANIAVKIFGPDLHELRRIAASVEAVMKSVDGAVDVAAEQQTDIPLVSIQFNRDAIARHGLTVGAVAEAVEAAFAGTVVSSVIEGQATFDMVVRYPPSMLESVETIASSPVATPSGAQVPLSALAEVRRDRGPNLVSRENVQRKIVVMANVAGRDLGGVVDDIRRRVAETVALPEGYYVEYGGQFESAQEATRTLVAVGTVVVIGIFLLLYIAFRSAPDAALVMLNLPLALIGGVAGVFVSGGVISVASIIGFITLFGIATRNGVMMVSHIRHLVEKEGVDDPVEAVRRGAVERLVPILMTALAAGLALVPLALSAGQPGSEIQAPMAVVILFGLLSSTVLNMFVVPVLYLRWGAVNRILSRAASARVLPAG